MEQTSPPTRRLAPQRKPKSPSATPNNPAAAPSKQKIDLSLDAGNSHDDVLYDDAGQGITQAMADWTLNEHNHVTNDEKSSENQSYHGEIASHESHSVHSVEAEEEIEIPKGYPPINPDEVSTSPPPCMPLLVVNLSSLCGGKPDLDERGLLIEQLKDALFGNDVDADKSGLDFDVKAVELFESGVGSHADDTVDLVKRVIALDQRSVGDHEMQKEDIDEEAVNYAIIPYPEFLSGSNSTQSTATTRLWKILYTSHPISPLNRLFTHLRNTSRSLLWKNEMHNELRLLAMDEHRHMIRRKKREEYEEWKGVRKERLDKLYEVRETFLLRVDMARGRYEKLVVERDRRVAVEMRRRRGDLWEESKKLLLEHNEPTADDVFAPDVFAPDESYDDDGWGGVIQEDDIIGTNDDTLNVVYEQNPHDDDDDDNSNEEWSPVGMSVVVQGSTDPAKCNENIARNKLESGTINKTRNSNSDAIHKLQPITTDDNAQRRSKKLEKMTNQDTSQEAIAKEVELVREKLKTNDECIAEAILKSLEERLEGVDNLLENLQEEEWADEEDEAENSHGDNDIHMEEDDASTEMTLLDQILAMILGALPVHFSGANSEEEHFRYVKEEHKSIRDGWKQVFGRLPPSNTVQPEPGVLGADSKIAEINALSKEKFRAVCNDSKDWDEVDWETLIP